MAPSTSQPPLVYDRVGQNRRRTWLLITLSFAVLIPSVFGAGFVLARVATGLAAAFASIFDPAYAAGMMASFHQFTLRFACVATAGVTAALGVLFWAIATSPGARLLVQVGARPADSTEREVEHLLENLALGAGLPRPKLYICESISPNAFAVGTSPEHAAITVTTGALRLLDRRELEGVLAHELSHIGNHDMLLNTVVASIGLFLRYLGLVTLYLGPLMACLIRAFISREREFLADADAALLTRFPQGLLRALAKIGAAGSAIPASNAAFSHFYFAEASVTDVSRFTGDLLATHPPITERIRRLLEFQGPDAIASLENAVHAGKHYRETHPLETHEAVLPESTSEFASICRGNPEGRVFRVLSKKPLPVYDQPDVTSEVVAYVQPGKLIVAFDDPGQFWQINTADWTFGYVSRSLELAPVPDLIPAEVYDERSRASAEAPLPPLE
ncbi:MAG TPA: M48 family metalloprotease [Bryobacteraceae bacterium]|nr:M48 family metalloprotease [Bryobacteraceae bacterium]